MFEKILIPTDGSETATEAAKTGIDLAVEHDATVHVLYVVSPPSSVVDGYQQVADQMEATGEQAVAEIAQLAERNGLTATTEVTHGVPHQNILEYAAANEIDLLVMGTHGRTGFGRYLLGSVTEKLVRLSETPVLTIRPTVDENE